MDKVAHFYKEPFPEFKEHFEHFLNYQTSISNKTKWLETEIRDLYEKIQLPEKIEDSNIYVFSFPMDITLAPIDIKIFPIGICCEIVEQDYIFMIKKYVNNDYRVNSIKVNVFTPTEFFMFGQEKHSIIFKLENNTQNKTILKKDTPIAIGLFLKTGIAF